MKAKSLNAKRTRNVEDHRCPAYSPFTGIFKNPSKQNQGTGLVQGVRSRVDVDYGRHLVGLSPNSADQVHWSPNGWCERPRIEPYVCTFFFIFSFALSN
jgi:ER degradation enhancer, mannosidase alpha-like 1